MITIKEDIEKNRSLNLSDIVNRIDNINEYYWKLMWVEGIAKDNFNMLGLENIAKKNFNMLELEELVNKSCNGLFIDINELLNIAKGLNHLIGLTLFGDKNKEKLTFIDRNYEDIKQDCDFFIEYVDSWLWEISSKDELLNKKLKKMNAE